MFKPDQPIQSYEEDVLGRTSFARSFGDAILSYEGKDSIVLGLFGAWGSGKTSIINMALEYINSSHKDKTSDSKPIVVRFNPWNYSEQNQLINQFFKELSVALKRADYASGAKKVGEKLETYSKLFDPLVLIPSAGSIFIILSVLFRSVGSALKGWGEAKSKDLESIKNELNELLDQQTNKIIIVIDDIDRLSDIEIRQIFQLVKSLGDFHNTIYVLAFDKKVVISALNRVQEGFGLEYLEKVVQVPFEVPLISKREVAQLLLSQLDELIKEVPQEKWDHVRWGNIYHGGLKHFFENIRDVTRYINSLKFGFNIVKDELNTIDFLAISAIQVFIPEVYYGIRDNKDIFAGVLDLTYGTSDVVKQQTKARCDEVISRASEFPQDVLKELLEMLFPKLQAIYSNVYYGSESLGDWRRDGRICSPDVFDIFFRFSIPKGEISQTEIEAILSLANNPDTFAEALLKLNEDGRILRFLERLEDYTRSQISEENIEPIITVLMDIGDLFPEGDTGFLSTRTSMRILRLSYQLSHRFDSHEERFRIFRNAIEKATKSLHTVVDEVSVQGQQHGKDDSKVKPEPEEKLTVNATQLTELEELACNKIESWANDGRLAKHRDLPSILFSWKRWGNPEDVDEFVNQMITDNDGLIDFVTSFLNKVTSSGMSDYVARISWHINLKSIAEFVDLKHIEPRIRDIFSSAEFEQLDDKKKLAIKTFLATIDGKIKDSLSNLD